MAEDPCAMRSLEQILCPDGCRCGNALPGLQGVRGRKAQAQKSKVCIVNGEGVGESMLGVVATEVIKTGRQIIPGSSLTNSCPLYRYNQYYTPYIV